MKFVVYAILLCWLCLLGSCKGSGVSSREVSNDSVITQARLLTMERAEHYTLVTVKNPWRAGEVLHRYVLVPADSLLPGNLPEGTVVRTPVRRALVYSSVHTALMKELGRFDALAGVTDAQYFTDAEVVNGLRNGTIADCGSSMGPTVEKVIEMSPDAILLSPYQDATYGQITKLDIPIIECADYMEFTPLGRAEWIKFYGELLGRRAMADSIYRAVEKAYCEIRQSCSRQSPSKRTKVLTEMVLSGVWNVPGGQSYMSQMIQDAGDEPSTGSLNLDFNQVLAVAQDADVWLIKSFFIHSLADLKGAYSLNDQFKAFQRHQVYVCDTNESHLFERFPFHPEVLLQEYADIFAHRTQNLQFFKPTN